MKLALASSAVLALALSGCVMTSAPATVQAECRVLRPAPHAAQAQTRSGQRWVSGTIEAGVRVCGHPRPRAR